MARGLFRKVSFMKTVGAYRSLWKRTLLRFFFPGYGMKGAGWLRDPKKAWYNWLYHRTSISLTRLLGYKPSFGGTVAALFVASLFNLVSLPADTAEAASKSKKIKRAAKERGSNFGKVKEFKDDVFHEPRKAKTAELNQTLPKNKPSYATTDPKQKTNFPTANIYNQSKKENITSQASNNTWQNETPSESKSITKKPDIANSYIPARNQKVERITVNEIVKNTYKNDLPKPPEQIHESVSKTIDENDLSVKPKSEKDQHVNKTMILENPNHAVLSTLKTGAYLDVIKDTESGKVALIHDGRVVGFISDSDSMAILTCLRLGRKMYAVITGINDENCEFEMWIESR